MSSRIFPIKNINFPAMQSLKHRIYFAFLLVAVFFVMPVARSYASEDECDYSKEYLNPQTIYIEATGADDQNVINSAIQQLDGSTKTSVFMKEGDYVLSDSIQMKETSILEGDKETVVTIEDHAGWETAKPFITAPDGEKNIEIKCFEMDGNYDNNTSQTADSCYRPLSWNSNFEDCEGKTDDRLFGRGYYDMVRLSGGENYSLHDMYLHDGAGDGYRVDRSRQVKFYDNLVFKLGHDAVAFYNCEYAEAWRSKITVRTNSGVRVENTNIVAVHDNIIESFDHWEAGGAGIQVVRDDRGALPMNQIFIYKNTLHHTYGPGIHIVASGTYEKADTVANIYHNIFYETGLDYSKDWVGAIVTSGFYELNVENNTIDKVYNYGIVAAITANGVSGWGYMTNIKNNIIVKTQHRRNSAGGSSGLHGVGIANLAYDTHLMSVSYNDVWYNVGGDIIGQGIFLGGPPIDRYALGGTAADDQSLSNNISLDPKFVDADGHDYHLQEGSPAIDAGDPASDFSKEPDPNGGRIDIGRYGNTSGAGAGKTGAAATIGGGGSDGTGSGSSGGGSSDDGDADDDGATTTPSKTEIPAYWDPGKAVTETSMTTAVEPALSPEEKALQALYGPQGSSAPTATAICSTVDEQGGLIPCGRNTNSSQTTWNECDECDLCAMVLMGQLSIEFMFKIAAVAANLTIIFAGFLYIFATGEMSLIAKAKLVVKYTLIGFIVIFAAFVIVDTLLTIFGYIDPLGGDWHTTC